MIAKKIPSMLWVGKRGGAMRLGGWGGGDYSAAGWERMIDCGIDTCWRFDSSKVPS